MENKNSVFLKKYFAEQNRQQQLNMLKDYMLTLSLEELTSFTLEPIHFLGDALKNPDVSDEMKSQIHNNLDELAFLMKGKVVA